MALADHPLGNVDPASSANRNDALITVAVVFVACNRLARIEEVRKGKCRLLPASVFAAIGIQAKLLALRRVHTVDANALAMNFDGVPVDDGSAAHKRFGKGCAGRAHDRQDD